MTHFSPSRIFAVVAAIVVAIGVPQSIGTAGASQAAAEARVDRSDVFAGSTAEPIAVSVTNTGIRTIDAVRIGVPSSNWQLVGAAADGWSAATDPAATTLTGGQLLPGSTLVAALTADTGRPAVDDRARWRIEVSDTAGQSYSAATGQSGTPNAITTTIRILRPGPTVVSPAGANDGTATEGQSVDVEFPLTNEGSAPVVLSPTATSHTGPRRSPGTLTLPASIAPGETASVTVDGVVFDKDVDTQRVRVHVINEELTVEQVLSRGWRVQEPVQLRPRSADLISPVSLDCNPDSGTAGQPLQCSILVDKVAGEPGAVLTTDTTFVINDSVNQPYRARLIQPVNIPAGSAERIKLSFERIVVPDPFNFGYYRPKIEFRGFDKNDAPISHDRFAPAERVLIRSR